MIMQSLIIGLILSSNIACSSIEEPYSNEFSGESIYGELTSPRQDSLYSAFQHSDTLSNLALHTWTQPQTKASTLTVTWSEHDLLCVFSLDKNNKVLYRDTTEVYNIKRDAHYGTITALVDTSATSYYLCYPYDAITTPVGATLEMEDIFFVDPSQVLVHQTGYFGDVSVLVAPSTLTQTTIQMKNYFSLMKFSSAATATRSRVGAIYDLRFLLNKGMSDYIGDRITLVSKTEHWYAVSHTPLTIYDFAYQNLSGTGSWIYFYTRTGKSSGKKCTLVRDTVYPVTLTR